jgi:manganese oxidase
MSPTQPIHPTPSTFPSTRHSPLGTRHSLSRKFAFLLSVALACPHLLLAADNVPAVVINDNRSPAGELRNGVLTIKLEIASGQWHPESDDGIAISIYAFAEAGHPLQNPGPLIRVPQGTEIHATIHNALPVATTVHGFHQRPGDDKDAFTLHPGATKDVRFSTGLPGSYLYWASTSGAPISQRSDVESQLSGALIVDPAGAAANAPPGAAANDRVFVIADWTSDPLPPRAGAEIVTINGKSWPYTERFTFNVGEPVRWRWLNPSVSNHAMHLHGFYYRINAIGDGEREQVFGQDARSSVVTIEDARPSVVTHRIDPGQSFDMTWVPERPGQWLFHCHMLAHMSPPQLPPDLVRTAAHASPHGAPQAIGMGGLVLGITVLGEKAGPKPPPWKPDRKLQLVIDERRSGQPLYAVDLRDPQQPPSESKAPTTPRLIGPAIVLTRGEPVEIEVVNRTKQSTAIHWHGIELESYYDGVPGWTGTAQQTTPAIAPGGSFVARMVPPRDGTFIYHTHWHDEVQLTNGIYGPLIVLPPQQKLDSERDKTFLFSGGSFQPFGFMLLINGHPQAAPLRLTTGIKYRFRLINIAPNNVALQVSLLQSGTPVKWRSIAKDGADLPLAAATFTTAVARVTVGETYDFEYEATSPQELVMQGYLPGPKLLTTQTLLFAAPRTGN